MFWFLSMCLLFTPVVLLPSSIAITSWLYSFLVSAGTSYGLGSRPGPRGSCFRLVADSLFSCISSSRVDQLYTACFCCCCFTSCPTAYSVSHRLCLGAVLVLARSIPLCLRFFRVADAVAGCVCGDAGRSSMANIRFPLLG